MKRMTETDIDSGREFCLRTSDDHKVIATVHDDGKRELAFFNSEKASDPHLQLQLEDADARRLGAILSGTMFRQSLPPEISERLGDTVVDWMRISEGSSAAGKTLEEIDLHRRTGMTVVALMRDDEFIDAPSATTRLEVGDRIIIVGQLRQMPLVMDQLVN